MLVLGHSINSRQVLPPFFSISLLLMLNTQHLTLDSSHSIRPTESLDPWQFTLNTSYRVTCSRTQTYPIPSHLFPSLQSNMKLWLQLPSHSRKLQLQLQILQYYEARGRRLVQLDSNPPIHPSIHSPRRKYRVTKPSIALPGRLNKN